MSVKGLIWDTGKSCNKSWDTSKALTGIPCNFYRFYSIASSKLVFTVVRNTFQMDRQTTWLKWAIDNPCISYREKMHCKQA